MEREKWMNGQTDEQTGKQKLKKRQMQFQQTINQHKQEFASYVGTSIQDKTYKKYKIDQRRS